MTGDALTAVATIAAAVASAGAAAWSGRAARRTARDHRRDDFSTVMKEIRTSLTEVKKELADQKAESARQAERLTDQDLALGWMQNRLRDLVSYIRRAGMEPPAAEPIPERARKHIHIDV
ncbi:hypothetical protein [Streptomyces sp. NPDC013489]|uniref:hypothetical protein n=1 Tax=Streptomyces sp. NPDC013489 TaxID=3155606 RepID=UPI0033FDCD50